MKTKVIWNIKHHEGTVVDIIPGRARIREDLIVDILENSTLEPIYLHGESFYLIHLVHREDKSIESVILEKLQMVDYKLRQVDLSQEEDLFMAKHITDNYFLNTNKHHS